jgi:hypothetical protein
VERNEELRNLYQIRIAEEFQPDQLVLVDESACNRITTRQSMAWSPIGSRARRRDFFLFEVRGKGTAVSFHCSLCLIGYRSQTVLLSFHLHGR